MGRKRKEWTSLIIWEEVGMREEVVHRVLEERKVWKTMAKLWKENMLSREATRKLYERVVIPNSGLWFGDVVIKCTREEGCRSI